MPPCEQPIGAANDGVKLIVGLGNPGARYNGTRHNVGFAVVDRLARGWNCPLTVEKFHAWFATADVDGERVVLLKPTTFMNRSGQAVAAAARFYQASEADLLVIGDDLALPVGRIRLRASGSAGSHNGLQSVIDYVGSPNWCRLRIGIGAAIGDPAVYVLSRFASDEESDIKKAVNRSADAVKHWVAHGVELTMTRFNGEPPDGGGS